MNSPLTDPSSRDCGCDKNSNVHHLLDPPSDVSLPGLLPYPPQHTVQQGMIDPLSLSLHCPCQFTQRQLTYSDYCTEPQLCQYCHLTGPVPGLPEGSHPNSVFAPWFTSEAILCSMMAGDLHTPVANSCVPQALDHQQLHEGLTEFTSHLTQSHPVQSRSPPDAPQRPRARTPEQADSSHGPPGPQGRTTLPIVGAQKNDRQRSTVDIGLVIGLDAVQHEDLDGEILAERYRERERERQGETQNYEEKWTHS